ncbi:unnamed protein product [Pieris macdunnoughi]|uniref:Peptidase S1 domain-containing protein n=1 Tax=Pieris macdunnoughi TaxID=345717 RepID=A0A821MD57_9NEOP|nr:unnamed protein product [Pieris macdunnoughi]
MEVVYFVLIFFAISVNSVAIHGPMLTRYNPCSLGVLYFDKLTNISWQGTINFSLYPNITDANIEITFDKPIRIFGASNNSTVYARNNWHSFLFKPRGVLPPRYFFYIAVIGDVSNVPNVVTVKLNNYTLCNPAVKNELNIQSYNATQPDDKYYRQVCGRRALHNAELSSIKTDAKAGDWPWHVAVLIRENISIYARYQCGGNIISRTAVLTAAHCLFYNSLPIHISRLLIEAGVDNLKLFNQPGRQLLNAVDVIVNPAYKSDESTADLAVIRVNAFRYTDYVQPICLWGPSYDKSNLYGQMAVVVGFGTTEENQLSDTLRSTYTVVQNDTTCISYSPQLYTSLLNEFTFCAGLDPNAGTSPLQGDSGGGLSISTVQPDHKVSWFLRGVLSKCGISNGETICNPKYYVIYTDVGPHYGWIYHHAGLNYISNIVY